MPLNLETLEAVQPQQQHAAPATPSTGTPSFDAMLAKLDAKGVAYVVKAGDATRYLGGRKIILNQCANKAHRKSGKTCVFQRLDGQWCHRCQSDDCKQFGFRRWYATLCPEDAEPPLAPNDELRLARSFLVQHSHNGNPPIRFYEGRWYLWEGCWRPLDSVEFTGLLYQTCKSNIMRSYVGLADAKGKPRAAPAFGKAAVGNVEMALRSLVASRDAGWIDGRGGRWLAFSDSLLDLDAWVAGQLVHIPQTAEYFSPNALTYPLTYTDAEPTLFLEKLREQFSAREVDAVQEFGGYCMTDDTSIQRILYAKGPPRSFKGTLDRTIKSTIGKHNAVSKTFESFLGPHAMEDIPGKTFLAISDSRPDPRISKKGVERLLSISGEDSMDINPKGKACYTADLKCKIMLAANILADFDDPTGALLSRFLFVETKVSHADNPDPKLLEKILSQQNEITWWFLRGLRRLLKNGKYTEPENRLRVQFEAQNNAVPCFVNANCEVTGRSEDKMDRDNVFSVYEAWCEDNMVAAMEKNVFFLRLYSAFPRIGKHERNISGVKWRTP